MTYCYVVGYRLPTGEFDYDGCWQEGGFVTQENATFAAVKAINQGEGTDYEVWLCDDEGNMLECLEES